MQARPARRVPEMHGKERSCDIRTITAADGKTTLFSWAKWSLHELSRLDDDNSTRSRNIRICLYDTDTAAEIEASMQSWSRNGLHQLHEFSETTNSDRISGRWFRPLRTPAWRVLRELCCEGVTRGRPSEKEEM